MPYASTPRPSFGFGPGLTPTVKALLAVNITVFLLQSLLAASGAGAWFDTTFGLMPAKVFGQLHLWQPVSYMFLHVTFFHILFNMFVLWMFGSELEALWGRREFLRYYLITGVGAGLTYMLLMPLLDPSTRYNVLMGASGAVYGLLAAFALLYPDRRIMLYFLVPIPVRIFVIGLIVIETISMWSSDNIGHLAHLGGMGVGYLYLRGGRRRLDALLRSRRKRKASSRFRVVGDKPPRRPGNGAGADEVDRILEKISREGLDSLTPDEREILRRASRH